MKIFPNTRFIILFSGFLLWASTFLSAQERDTLLIANLLQQSPYHFKHVLANPENYEVQIMYTQVWRDSSYYPHLKHFSYHLDSKKYFNPASLVKLPTVALSLEKLGEIIVPGVHKFAPMKTDSTSACQYVYPEADVPIAAYPCIASYMEQMLLVSDNDAYSRLYEFLGQAYIWQKLQEKGYPNLQIMRRFEDCDSTENRYTNPIHFYDRSGALIYTQEAAYNPFPYSFPLGKIQKGISYTNDDWEVIPEPKDFTYGNYVPLSDIHHILISLMMPEAVPIHQRFHLGAGDYKFIRQCLQAYPREAIWTQYPLGKGYYDSYKKYLYYGRKNRDLNPSLRIYNVVGWWDGYLSDCAYFLDTRQGIEFFLSAVIYVNQNNRFDYKFEYQSIGFPFLENLGKTIFAYEKSLKKPYPARGFPKD